MSNRNGNGNGNGKEKHASPGNRITVRPGDVSPKAAASKESADGNDWTAPAVSLLADQIERLARDLNRAQLRDYVELTHKPWLLVWRSFISGLSRGIGTAIGFTFFAATIVWILQLLGKLNLPIVGDYIADIVRIVYRQLQINPY